MRVFVTGATGFVGSAIVPELLAHGHTVVGLARSDRSAADLADAGAEVHRGDLHDLDSLRTGAAAADGVIHCAFVHDFSRMAAAGRTDLAAVETIGAALEGSGRPFVVTSGIGLLAPGRLATEEDVPDPASPGAHRAPSEAATVALADRGVRSAIVRLPPTVHAQGDRGFVPFLIAIACEQGVSAHIGDGANRWAAVHRLDAACAFRLALESAAPGSVVHAVSEEGIPTREIAAAVGRGLGLPVTSVTPEDAGGHFGWIGGFFAADIPASSAATGERLGWKPDGVGLLADLAASHYFTDARPAAA